MLLSITLLLYVSLGQSSWMVCAVRVGTVSFLFLARDIEIQGEPGDQGRPAHGDAALAPLLLGVFAIFPWRLKLSLSDLFLLPGKVVVRLGGESGLVIEAGNPGEPKPARSTYAAAAHLFAKYQLFFFNLAKMYPGKM